ncbi:MAG: hypothetical protein RL213_233 [Bacteroidota bacterium]|jgi:predicted short-subunit dehydrogenase-like oxidoreductase (DUF2520 family)
MKIVLIGSGNIASHLGKALTENGHRILQVCGRNPKTTIALARRLKAEPVAGITSINDKADVYVIAVPDREIPAVATAFPYSEKTVVHTSGSVALEVFPVSFANAGCFYLLQTFTGGKSVKYREVPVCIEARSGEATSRLRRLAKTVSGKVVELDSEKRLWMHLAAVIVNNFTNHLFYLAGNILESQGLEFELLHPLIKETARKATSMSPLEAQTGPARRGDTETIRKHLQLLGQGSRSADIYRLISESIESVSGPIL